VLAEPAQPTSPSPTGDTGEPTQPPPESELVQARSDAHTSTYRQADGSYVAEVATTVVNYEDDGGAWQPIDNTLVPSKADGYAYANAANAYRASIPADFGRTPVRVAADEGWVEFKLAGAEGQATADGSVATVDSRVDGATVAYRATGPGLKETLTLHQPPAEPPSYLFDVAASPDLTPTLDDDGSVVFADRAGEAAFSLPPAFMADAADTVPPSPESDDPVPAISTDVSYRLDKAETGWTLTVTPDYTWLTDPARVYPVVIDPTVTLQPASTDCWMSSGTDHATSYCGATSDFIRAGWTTAGLKRRGLVSFDLTTIPTTATISDANLALYLDSSQTTNVAAADYKVYRPGHTWTGSASWDKYDGTTAWAVLGGDPGSIVYDTTNLNGSTSGYKHWHPTTLIQSYVDGSLVDKGMLLKQTESVNSVLFFYSSDDSDSTKWPELTIDYTDVPPAPDVQLRPCTDPCTSAPFETSSATPSFRMTSTDIDGDDVTYNLKVRTYPGAVSKVNETTDPQPSGQPTTVTADFGALVDGGSYEYQASASDATGTSTTAWTRFDVDVPNGSPTNLPGSTSHISTDTTWTAAGSPYVLSHDVIVDDGKTLTIEPGVVVKINGSGALRVSGQLIARGSASEPIYFTSYLDDAVGGDTNGSSGGTTPAAGNFSDAIAFEQPQSGGEVAAESRPASVLDNVSFTYGGGTGGCSSSTPMVNIDPWSRVSITNSVFAHTLKAMDVDQDAAPSGISGLLVKKTLFTDYDCALQAHWGEFTDDIFQDTTGEALHITLGAPDRLDFEHNWVYGPVTFIGSNPGYGPDVVKMRDNGFIAAGWGDTNSSYVYPTDLTLNWWGGVVGAAPTCYSANYMPPLAKKIFGVCPPGGIGTNNEYFTTVLPALTEPPDPVVAGLESDPVWAGQIPQEQQFGESPQFAARGSGDMSDPVNSATGSYTEQVVDAFVPAMSMDLSATRTYNSADTSVGPLGQGWSFKYDMGLTFPDADTVVLHAGDGQQVQYYQQPDGSYQGAPGALADLVELGSGDFEATTRAGLVYEFDSSGKVQTVTDRQGAQLVFAYSSGKLSSVTNGTRSLGFTFTGSRLTRVTLADGRHVDYAYDVGTSTFLESVTALNGEETDYVYTNGKLTTETDPLSHDVVTLDYDAVTGRVTDQWDALSHHTTFDWDDGTETETMTDPRGKVWTDVYNSGVIASRTDPEGDTTTYGYDPNLQLVATTDARGFRSTYEYSKAGDLIAFHGPSGTTTTKYNDVHNKVKSVNGRGYATTYGYNGRDQMNEVVRTGVSGDNTTTYHYDSTTHLLDQVHDANDKITAYTYTANGDLESVTTPEGAETSYVYDTVGRMTKEISPLANGRYGGTASSHATVYTYKDDDQIESVTDPLGNETQYDYYADGRLETVTDAKGREQTTTYYADGKVHEVQGTDPLIDPVVYTYDDNANVETVTDEEGRVTTYGYDDANRRNDADTPIGEWTYGYDSNGNLGTVTDPDNATTTMRYTAGNQLRLVDYPGSSSPDVTFRYDADRNRSLMSSAAADVEYEYNSLDRLTAVHVTRAGDSERSFGYSYRATGEISSVTLPTALVQNYTYNDDGQVLTAKVGTTPTTATYTYDDGLLATAVLGDGATRTYTYDDASQIEEVEDVKASSTVILDDTYTLDETGNPTLISHNGGSSDAYTYDDSDRVTKVCYNAANCTSPTDYVGWTYDGVGNRTSEIRPSGTTTSTYDGTGQLDYTTAPGSVVTQYGHNNLGQMTTAGDYTFTYNAAGQMASADDGVTTSDYTYDGDGRRLQSDDGTNVVNFWWDPITYRLAYEANGSEVKQREYLYGAGELGFIGPTGTYNYYHLDGQASVRQVTGSTGSTKRQYVWEPYGVNRSTSTTGTPDANEIGWAGQYGDPTGLVHLRARQYDPAIGAFTAPDPADGVGVGGYVYAAGNPMTGRDQLGLWPDLGGVVDAATGAWDTATDVADNVLDAAGSSATGIIHTVRAFPGQIYDGVIDTVTSMASSFGGCFEEKGTCAWGPIHDAWNVVQQVGAIGASCAGGAAIALSGLSGPLARYAVYNPEAAAQLSLSVGVVGCGAGVFVGKTEFAGILDTQVP
jgi:RHS repeat-associated protein